MSHTAQVDHSFSMPANASGLAAYQRGERERGQNAGAMAFLAERDVSHPSLSGEGTMITIGPKVIVAGAATLALGAGTGIAAAAMMTSASPVDSSGVLHGCWTNR